MQRSAWMAASLALLVVAPLAGAVLPDKTDPLPVPGGEKVLAEGVGILVPLGCSLGSGQTVLAENTNVTGTLTADVGANCEFKFTPNPSFNGAAFYLTLTTSDFDLYIKKGAVPTTSVYDCRPFLGSTNPESCLSVVTDATPIYAMVRRFSGSGDFTIRALSKNLAPLCPAGNNAIANGVAVEHAATQVVGGACFYQLTPDANTDVIRTTASPEGAAFGIYVKRGAVPTTSSYDCLASASFLVRTCDVVANGMDVFIMVRRSSAVGVGQFSVRADEIVFPTLSAGQPVQGNVAHLAMNMYKVLAPAGSRLLAVAIGGPDPGYVCVVTTACAATDFKDADLYVRHSSKGLPTTSLYDCRSWAVGTQDACVFSTELFGTPLANDPLSAVAAPGPANVKAYQGDGKYFVGVRGFRGPADYVAVALVA